MKIKMLLVALLLAVSVPSAFAAKPYIGAAGGLSIIHEEDVTIPGLSTNTTASYDKGFGFNLCGGTRFYGGRVEWEYGYKKTDVDKFSGPDGSAGVSDSGINVMSYMINGYMENTSEPDYTPYIGAGLGFINGKFTAQGEKFNDTVAGYQLMVGAGFKINKNVTLDISYRFQGAAEELSVDGANIPYKSSNIYAGIRYAFVD